MIQILQRAIEVLVHVMAEGNEAGECQVSVDGLETCLPLLQVLDGDLKHILIS